MIDGFEYLGSGGGGGGGGGGLKPEQKGQVVPEPVKVPVPEKPAPVQKATKGEEKWSVKETKTETPATKKPESETVERGEKTQEEKTNIVRRGVPDGTQTGEGNFDYGGAGKGTGPGIGIGVGPGSGGGGFGFGSYLQIVRQRIWSEWTAFYGSNLSCVVSLVVSRGGEITSIRLEKSSGDSFYDTVALRAVRNASPLPPLPTGFPQSEQQFRIQFRLVD